MTRWELPTRLRGRGESLYMTLIRCIDEEASGEVGMRIRRPVCMTVNTSRQVQRQFFGMFFECSAERSCIHVTREVGVTLPDELRQHILEFRFCDWENELESSEMHPQHRAILRRWSHDPDAPLFLVESDADREEAFFHARSLFLSYSRHDRELVEHLFRQLDERGLPVWMDRQRLRSGEEWEQRILQSLKSSRLVCALVSPAALDSGWVRKELEFAFENGIPVLPVKIGSFEVPLEFGERHARRQWLELAAPDQAPSSSEVNAIERAYRDCAQELVRVTSAGADR